MTQLPGLQFTTISGMAAILGEGEVDELGSVGWVVADPFPSQFWGGD